jgi:hypothetical protein
VREMLDNRNAPERRAEKGTFDASPIAT